MLKEFKEFAMKGNVLDLAVGVVIGAAFTGIVDSVVKGIFSPIIGMITGGTDFSKKTLEINGVQLLWGSVLTQLINFVIVAFFLFLVVKAVNAMKRKEEPPVETVAEVPVDTALLTEIRDLLKSRA